MLSSFARSFRRSPSYVFCRRLCDSTQPKNGASFGRNVRLRVASGSACAAIVSVYLLWKQKGSVAHAAERLQPSPPLLEEQQNHGGVEEAPKEKELEECENKKRKHVSFRDRRYVAYEDRIRAYSTPDKVFRYFATLKVMDSDGESFIYMTPQDFVRSITPGAVQPHGLGLDQFKRIDAKAVESFQQTDDGGIFSQIGRLISFSDYLFLLTVLSTPKRHFEIAFHMFDLNGDGNVDKQEFDKVCDVLTKKTAVGLRHRDHSAVGNVAKPVGSSLSNNLFGSDGGHKLTASNFSEFHDRLQDGVLKIEFDQYQNEDGLISELDFCKLLLTYTEFSDSKKRAFKKRVKAVFGKGKQGLTFQQYRAFSHFLDHLNEIEIALSMHSAAGAGITRDDLQHVAKSVTEVLLDDHLVNVVFSMFDVDRDDTLTRREFVSVLKDRRQRGLNKSKDTGVARLISAMWSCARQTALW